MRIDDVRKLIKLVEESDIGELEVREWWGKVKISRMPPAGSNGSLMVTGSFPAGMLANSMSPAALPPVAASAVNGTESGAAGAKSGSSADDMAGLTPFKSPMVGTFYRAPAPDADPYVETNDRIEVGQTLCIIEAMKLMNEIQSEHRGRVVKIVVGNGQPVEYGQVLFWVDES